MIKSISIQNYKSVKELDIPVKRINIFIGEHNSGKSNILEALTWFSLNSLESKNFNEIFRFKTATDFFYDFDVTHPIEVRTGLLNLIIRYAKNANGALANSLEGLIYGSDSGFNPLTSDDFNNINNKFQNAKYHSFRLAFDGTIENVKGFFESSFRTYTFKKLKSFENSFRPFLNPPFGENIPSLLVSNRHYKDLVSSIFKEKGFRLMLKPTEGDINMAKDINDELYSYPYTAISETLQRVVFYVLAIESNKNSIIVLDEPESNTFPMYTKQLAEMIALDGNENQYFIATHDPYLLNSLVSKTPVQDLAVFVTKMENYLTNAYLVNESDLAAVLDKGLDIYFNLNKIVNQ